MNRKGSTGTKGGQANTNRQIAHSAIVNPKISKVCWFATHKSRIFYDLYANHKSANSLVHVTVQQPQIHKQLATLPKRKTNSVSKSPKKEQWLKTQSPKIHLLHKDLFSTKNEGILRKKIAFVNCRFVALQITKRSVRKSQIRKLPLLQKVPVSKVSYEFY
jgi:hypothetical protein